MISTDKLVEALRQHIPAGQLIENAPMAHYTTLRLGGPAQVLADISTERQLSAALRTARQLDCPVTVIGNGSNLLVKDGGIPGLTLRLGERFSQVIGPLRQSDGEYTLTAQAGATLQKLCNAAMDASLTGLEFASGIPGTAGGAVYMNAGAFDGEMKDVVLGVAAMDGEGRSLSFNAKEMEFGYRTSIIRHLPQPCVVTSVIVSLQKGDGQAIRQAMEANRARRRDKQPLELPSCGSTFKRPQGNYAGTLIEQCGLKGFRIGGASVSTRHAGFLVNDQGGTAADYLALIAHVQKTVLQQTGVALEPEVRIIGQDAPAISRA